MPTETVELDGHIVDSLILAKVLDLILDAGADYRMVDVDIGKTNLDPSQAVIEVAHPDPEALELLLEQVQVHGANRQGHGDARLVAADQDGVLPAGFYSTTNLATEVRVDGHWLEVENPEMDCGLVVLERRRRARWSGPCRCTGWRSATSSSSATTACASARPTSPRRAVVRVHELRGVVGEAEGPVAGPGGRAHRGRP